MNRLQFVGLLFSRNSSLLIASLNFQLKRYMRFKEQNPTYQKGVDPEGFSVLGEADVMTVLPYLDQHGRRILLFRIGGELGAG